MTAHPPTPVPQPFLHDLVTCVQAPVVALGGADGQLRRGGGQGLFCHDYRVVCELVADVDGHPPVPVGHYQPDAATARFVAVVRHLGDASADPTVRLERERRIIGDGLTEQLTLINASRRPINATLRVTAAVDLAELGTVKHGETTPLVPPSLAGADHASWAGERAQSTLSATGTPELSVDIERLRISWRVTVPPQQRWTATIRIAATGRHPDPTNVFTGVSTPPQWQEVSVTGPGELSRLIDRGLADLTGLRLTDPRAPTDVFAAAGSPWYLTLFGRDSLWAARLTLPLGTDLAAGTLRTLARRQGTRHDHETAEAPGKILHEVRNQPSGVGGLPPVYYGTVDATALWVCLLHDAWRWGMPAAEVADLLDPLERALGWLIKESDSDGDGFLEYLDLTGRGLANQGWKDSGDAIQFPDGTIAEPPIALSEAQAYAYEAAQSGAALLTAFERSGATEARVWAERLRGRFQAEFWVSDAHGRFPAIALDGAKQPVPTAASNLGHLVGTGLLQPAETAAVATRLSQPDLDCGYGLRTMTADAAGFNPLGYHAGTIWPHDTAIAIRNLALAGQPAVAATLANGLLRAAPAFGHRLPELYGGTDAHAGEAVLAYPAACRPQAWSAVAAVAVLQAALGITADLPGGRLTVRPPTEFSQWFPLRVSGLRLAGHPLTVAVDGDGRAEVETAAPVTVVT